MFEMRTPMARQDFTKLIAFFSGGLIKPSNLFRSQMKTPEILSELLFDTLMYLVINIWNIIQ